MNLTSDAPLLPGKRWSRSTKLIAAIAAIPLAAYLPGFFMALSSGFATSLPFWADAKDYTCSQTRTQTLMVRVSPYVDPKAVKKKNADWDCRRIAILDEHDIFADRADGPDGGYYVRIYTPAPRHAAALTEGQASAPSEVVNLPARAPAVREAKAAIPGQRSSQQASP